MTITGRPKKPTALKLLEGTFRPDRANPDEPKVELTNDKPPSWLRGRARKGWKEFAPLMRNMRVLTDADIAALSMLCDAFGEFIECRQIVREVGRTYETTNKLGERMIKARPEVAMAASAWSRAAKMLSDFGLTPASRSRIKAQPEKEEDPFETYLSQTAN